MLSQDLYTTRNVCERVWLTSMMWASKEAELAHLHFPLVPQIQVKTRFIIVFFLPLYLQKTKKLCFSSVICLKWHYIQTWGLAVILVPFFHCHPHPISFSVLSFISIPLSPFMSYLKPSHTYSSTSQYHRWPELSSKGRSDPVTPCLKSLVIIRFRTKPKF